MTHMHACPPHSRVMTVAPHLSLIHPMMPRLAKFGLHLALGFVRLAKSNLHNTDDQGCRTAFGPRDIARSTVRHFVHRSSHTVMDADRPRPLHQDPKQPPARLPSPPRAQVSGLELTNTGRHRGGGKASNSLFKRPKHWKCPPGSAQAKNDPCFTKIAPKRWLLCCGAHEPCHCVNKSE
jgi:hypothetical protein